MNQPGFEVSSAGINNDALNPLTPEEIQWADVIFVMEKFQRNKIQKKFKEYLNNKKIICLDVPDEFEFMDPALINFQLLGVIRQVVRQKKRGGNRQPAGRFSELLVMSSAVLLNDHPVISEDHESQHDQKKHDQSQKSSGR